MQRLFRTVAVVSFLAFISLTAGTVQTVGSWGSIDWVKRVVVATGLGAPSPSMPAAAARPNALRAAQLTALRNALEIVKGISITSTTTVENRMVSSDDVSTRIDGFVKGFEQQGKPKYMNDATIELTVEIPIDGGLSEELLPASVTDTPPALQGMKETKKKPAMSGIIVDCSGLPIKPAMLPGIFDEDNKEIYGESTIGRTFAVKSGAAAYAQTVAEAKLLVDKIGTQPLVIKAIKAIGQGSTDALISKKDGASIRGNPANLSVLEQCRVVFVIDK